MKRRSFLQMLTALTGVPFLPKIVTFNTVTVDTTLTGHILPCYGQLPKGWLPCDGRELSPNCYPKLFAALDRPKPFVLPDLNTTYSHGIADPGHQHGTEMYGQYVIKT